MEPDAAYATSGIITGAAPPRKTSRLHLSFACLWSERWGPPHSIEEIFPYVYLDGIFLKRSWGGEVRNVAVLVAIGVAADGFRQVLGVAEGAKEDKQSWTNFLRYLKGR